MKTGSFVFLLAVSASVMCAQSAAPSGDVTIKMSQSSPEYCLGPWSSTSAEAALPAHGPADITLRLPLKVRYENHRSETIFLPRAYDFLTRVTAENGSIIYSRRGGGGFPAGTDVKGEMAASRPDASKKIISLLDPPGCEGRVVHGAGLGAMSPGYDRSRLF